VLCERRHALGKGGSLQQPNKAFELVINLKAKVARSHRSAVANVAGD
jgi:hypothetical protein